MQYLCTEEKIKQDVSKKENKKIHKFKTSQDYKDICYMIDHVNDISVRLDVLEKLGYHIGTDIVKNDLGVKNILIGKRNEIRIQVTPKYKNINVANCAILNNFK